MDTDNVTIGRDSGDDKRLQGITAGIIGVGVVGGAMYRWLAKRGATLLRLDPAKGFHDNLDDASVVFVCVPTPTVDGYQKGSIVTCVVDAIPGNKTVCIRSTVIPGTTDRLQREYPRHALFHWPEFLCQRTADHDMTHPLLSIIGHSVTTMYAMPSELLSILPPSTHHTTAINAEFYKYARNSFFCVKNAFFNQLATVAERHGISPYDIAGLACRDAEVGGIHTLTPHNGKRGFSGACLPKDSEAFSSYAAQYGTPLLSLDIAIAYNHSLLRRQGIRD